MLVEILEIEGTPSTAGTEVIPDTPVISRARKSRRETNKNKNIWVPVAAVRQATAEWQQEH